MSALAPVRAFYDAVARGDAPDVLALLHPDLSWTEAEGFPYFSGTWRTPRDVLEKLLIPLGRDWTDFSAVPQEMIEAGERVITFGAYAGTYKATGKAVRAPFAHRWEVRDGQLARFDMYTDTLLIHRAMR
ncbi:MAG: nuclear transport factor 2 family protein [Acetobacteraceae bacterium]|nr:nuclear transport factor 2 family protein [Acetobacteraceae bacterium]